MTIVDVSKNLYCFAWEAAELECPYPLRSEPFGYAATLFDLCSKLGAMRHEDVPGLLIANHQAVASFGQVQCNKQAQAGI